MRNAADARTRVGWQHDELPTPICRCQCALRGEMALAMARGAERHAIRPKADLTAIVDACYAPAKNHEAWGRDVAGTLARALQGTAHVGLVALRHDAAFAKLEPLAAIMPPSPVADGDFDVETLCGMLGPNALRHWFYPPGLVTSHRALDPGTEKPIQARTDGYRRAMAADDVFALVVHPAPGVALAVFSPLGRGVRLSRRDRTHLAQIALHVESGFRMRSRAGAVRAVLTPTGALVDGDVPAPVRERFATSARVVDVARAKRDLDPWTALVGGEVSVVPRMRGSRRVYELVENAHASRPFRALSNREVDVLSVAARGAPAKLCAYALGLSASTVSSSLASAAAKIGVASRVELLRIAALLTRDPRVELDDASLTRAEHEILALVQEGHSNAEMARRRGRSLRTIANQVASLLMKTKSPSRRALAVRNVPR
jgi:DNA-binding CsgD family transcriptional regulator